METDTSTPLQNKPRKRTTVSAQNMEKMESFKSEGGILSELPSRYRTGGKPANRTLVALLVLALIGGGGYYAWHMANNSPASQAQTNTPTPTPDADQILVTQVSKSASLPQEKPEIITITNPAGLAVKDQFFLGALEGDKLLVYRSAAQVFLFSPTRQLLINSGPLTPTNSSLELAVATPTPTLTESITASVEIRNGTTTTGLAKQTADSLAGNTSFRVEGISNAANQAYQKTIIFSLHPEATPLANTLAALLKGEVVGSLPKEEGLPSTDIVVILGTAQ
ncbi:MAG: LytR C-terminal domain-containing protein [Candidatus Doudnabacteria bacterium]|nr:LytR C-terminal domain-containing protein [Candidatus Doudnabacteria bacterium]